MEKAFEQYSLWCNEILPQDMINELKSIEKNNEEIHDRFCSHMKFGTSGLRGIMGAGTARMNEIVIRRATHAIADYLSEKRENPVVAVSFDTRKKSREFAKQTAETLASRGIDVFIACNPQPVPLLSFLVKKLNLNAGIMITASHNPKEYNGYKVYDSKGNQIDDDKARIIEAYIEKRDYFEKVSDASRKGFVEYIPCEIIDSYDEEVCRNILWWNEEENCRQVMRNLSVTYTPLDGCGMPHALKVMKNLGIENINIVSSQTETDGEFRTCPSPNPESEDAFNEAIKEHGDKKADIMLATDPDSDRVGAAVLHKGEYVKLSGNQVGELICDYICSCRKDVKDKKVFKSIVSSPIVEILAKSHGACVENTLTGFKNIALKMEELKASGKEEEFLYGFEESLGYLYGTYTRDKDAVMGCQLICLAAARCKDMGITLVDRLQQIYDQYGYIESRNWSRKFKREKDRKIISGVMSDFFEGKLKEINGLEVKADVTYASKSIFQGYVGENKFIVRPSGTELKLKFYVFAKGVSREDAENTAEILIDELKKYTEENIRRREI